MKNVPSIVLSGYVLKGLLTITLALLLASGCGSGQQPVGVAPTAATPANPAVDDINRSLSVLTQQPSNAAGEYQLGPEDLLKITLYNIPPGETLAPRETDVRVTQEGKIKLPLVGEIAVAGMSTFELQRLLRERYGQYLHHPQVGVQVVEHRSQQVSVMGAVQSPSVLQLTGPKTLVDVLAMAGGISPNAGSQVHITRQGPEGRQTFVVDLLALTTNPGAVNRPVQGGDLVHVPEAGTFFVDGAVSKPGSYPLLQPYTLSQALVVAGGVQHHLADYSSVSLFRRRDPLTFDKIAVDLNAVRSGGTPDPKIQPDDVIVVPISTGKYLIDRFIGTIGLPRIPTN
jgi:polysaccharide export outer membrane protein